MYSTSNMKEISPVEAPAVRRVKKNFGEKYIPVLGATPGWANVLSQLPSPPDVDAVQEDQISCF